MESQYGELKWKIIENTIKRIGDFSENDLNFIEQGYVKIYSIEIS
jgi:hypothetical protein